MGRSIWTIKKEPSWCDNTAQKFIQWNIKNVETPRKLIISFFLTDLIILVDFFSIQITYLHHSPKIINEAKPAQNIWTQIIWMVRHKEIIFFDWHECNKCMYFYCGFILLRTLLIIMSNANSWKYPLNKISHLTGSGLV